jgi:hypothetical protein
MTAAARDVDRATTPAPESSEQSTDVPSARPTSVPENFDAEWLSAALACGAGSSGVPRDLAVPNRVPGARCDGLDLATAFLLLHVDGRSSIVQIAACAQLELADVTASFLVLLNLGLIDFAGTAHSQIPPESGTFSRSWFAVDDLAPRPERAAQKK